MPDLVTITVRRDDLNRVLNMAQDWSDSLAEAAGRNDSTLRVVKTQRMSIARIIAARRKAPDV